jgi:hypothetical protein
MVAVSDHWRARPHPYLPAVSALRLGMAGRDLKLEFLTDTTVLKHKGPLRMQALQPVADAFLQNARRLVHMQSVPFLLAHALRAIERSEAGALMQLTGSIQPIEVDDPRAVQLRKIQIELYRAQIEEQKAEPKKSVADTHRVTLEVLRTLSKHAAPISGLDSFLAAIIVNTWTAFETLSGDLWEAALNCHPEILSDLSRGGNDERAIPIGLLQKYKFDLSNAMGTILKERNIRFDKLENIRDNYEWAFGKESTVAESLADKSLDSLSSVRNLFVHRAGVVDKRYLNRTKNLPCAPSAAIGTPILLDGESVLNLTRPVMGRGVELLGFVDDWLAEH